MRIVDNLIALRIIYLLSTPFEKFDAYKLGLIDANGNNLKKAKTPQEKNATSMLHRLVWNIKKIINLAPGGKTRIGSLAAAYLLVREAYEKDLSDEQFETLILENFEELSKEPLEEEYKKISLVLNIFEDGAIVNVSGPSVSTDTPKISGKNKSTFGTTPDASKYKEGIAPFRKVAKLP